MKFCQRHWDSLRKAIHARGLEPFVAKSGRAAVENMVLELEGRADEAKFDPLMAAHNMIVARALELGGLYLMTGDYCPVCEAIKGSQSEDYWIDGPADAVQEEAQKRGR